MEFKRNRLSNVLPVGPYGNHYKSEVNKKRRSLLPINAIKPYFNLVEYHLIDENNEIELLIKCNSTNILQKVHYQRIYYNNNNCTEIATRYRSDSDNAKILIHSFKVNSITECLFNKRTAFNYFSNKKYLLNEALLTSNSEIFNKLLSKNVDITFLIGIGSKKSRINIFWYWGFTDIVGLY